MTRKYYFRFFRYISHVATSEPISGHQGSTADPKQQQSVVSPVEVLRETSFADAGQGVCLGGGEQDPDIRTMAVSLTRACTNIALSTCLLTVFFGHLLCMEFTVAEKEEWYTAFINTTYLDPVTLELKTDKSECGRYGEHSPKKEARGLVLLPTFFRDRQGCHINVKFPMAFPNLTWVALIAAGNCTFREKISNAASRNASAVVIYNVGSNNPNDTITMPHQGTGDIIAVMIPELKGQDIVALLEQHVTVMMDITVGTRNLQKYVSRTSVVFVSISFIVLMTISLAWLVFYYIQRFRYVNARDRNQRRLGDAAKKAICRLPVRTIRKGDKEIDSDFDSCAVCIESYKPNDVVRILPCRHLFHKHCIDPWLQDQRTCPMCKTNILKALGIMPHADGSDEMPPEYEASVGAITGASEMTVNESSAVLDPGAPGSISLQRLSDHDDQVPPAAEDGPDYTGDHPALSSDLDPQSTGVYGGVPVEDQARGAPGDGPELPG